MKNITTVKTVLTASSVTPFMIQRKPLSVTLIYDSTGLRIKSEPFFNDLKFKSEHLKRHKNQ